MVLRATIIIEKLKRHMFHIVAGEPIPDCFNPLRKKRSCWRIIQCSDFVPIYKFLPDGIQRKLSARIQSNILLEI